MKIYDLKHKLLEIFIELIKIPSPSLAEDNVINWVINFCEQYGIFCALDDYKNIYIKIEAKNSNLQPILLSAHMDVVGDLSPVNPEVHGSFIKTDGKRTLGADNKAGVACALMLAAELTQANDIDHGGLEIILTRDEEHGMSGIKHVKFDEIQSKYALVLDSDKLGQLLVSGADYTKFVLKVKTEKGGHSGLDIHDCDRLNAAKLICDLVAKIPQGVYYSNETGTITSINLGTIIGGDIQNSGAKILSDKIFAPNYLNYFIKHAVTNVINTEAQAAYSIRSASMEKENDLKQMIMGIISDFNRQHEGLAKAEGEFSQHLPMFDKSDDDLIEKLHKSACEKIGVKQNISSFHAGAETHIYAQNFNKNGEKFLPFLVGVADIYNMHSNDEKVDYNSLLKGYEVLKELFYQFNA